MDPKKKVLTLLVKVCTHYKEFPISCPIKILTGVIAKAFPGQNGNNPSSEKSGSSFYKI